jgi:methyl-accepting chemotaxis protein
MLDHLTKLSMHRKTSLLLGVGALGFLIYFYQSSSISFQSRETISQVISRDLPLLSGFTDLHDSICGFQQEIQLLVDGGKGSRRSVKAWQDSMENLDLKVQQMFSLGIDSESSVGMTHRKLSQRFRRLRPILERKSQGNGLAKAELNEIQSFLKDVGGWRDQVDALEGSLGEKIKASLKQVNHRHRKGFFSGIILMIVASAVGMILIVVMWKISRALNEANARLGDASHRMDEICAETLVSSDQLKSSSIRQAHSATETSHSMEEIKKLLHRTYEITSEASQVSDESYLEANKGRGVIDDLRSSMKGIETSYRELEEVNEVVRQIHEKTQVIHDIVFKTQLLSFNANIEAARAGQLGRGFAVVATEVGNLADLSGQAAEEIEGLLETSARRVASAIDQTRNRIEKAKNMSNRCEEVFQALIGRTGEIRHMVGNITTSASEQSKGVEQVARAMVDLNQSAGETEDLAESMTQLADQLKNQSDSLSFSIQSLNVLVRGRGNGILPLAEEEIMTKKWGSVAPHSETSRDRSA